MNWQKDGDYSLKSDTGYRIAKSSHTSGDWQYASIFNHSVIGVDWTAKEAKARCVAHLGEVK